MFENYTLLNVEYIMRAREERLRKFLLVDLSTNNTSIGVPHSRGVVGPVLSVFVTNRFLVD